MIFLLDNLFTSLYQQKGGAFCRINIQKKIHFN